MSKKNDITDITVTLRFHDYDDKEHVLQIPRMGLVGVVDMAMTAARESRTESNRNHSGSSCSGTGRWRKKRTPGGAARTGDGPGQTAVHQ